MGDSMDDGQLAPLGPTGSMPRTRATARDEAYCAWVLPCVSRTFSVSIEALPNELRERIRVAYLLCRMVDTIEDEPRMDEGARQALFDAFEEQLACDEAPPETFERACKRLGGQPGAAEDIDLCRHAGAVLRMFRDIPAPEREIIRSRVLTMSRGMRWYCKSLDERGRLEIENLEMLEDYCYVVAGTVGELLTGLFERYVGDLDADTGASLRARAVPFGLALQMVNLLKDVSQDWERAVIYLPRELAEGRGLPLDCILDPRWRLQALAVVGDVAARAREHLASALEYTLLWPGPHSAPIRRFCAVPLALAQVTLDEIERGPDTLRPGKVPKVSREVVGGIVDGVWRSMHDPEPLRRFLQRCARAE